MSESGAKLLHDTYHKVVGEHPKPEMEQWEVARELLEASYHHQFPTDLEPGTWQLCLRVMDEELILDPRTRERLQEELTHAA